MAPRAAKGDEDRSRRVGQGLPCDGLPARPWSFYISSSGGGLNQGLVSDFEVERGKQLGMEGHFLA